MPEGRHKACPYMREDRGNEIYKTVRLRFAQRANPKGVALRNLARSFNHCRRNALRVRGPGYHTSLRADKVDARVAACESELVHEH